MAFQNSFNNIIENLNNKTNYFESFYEYYTSVNINFENYLNIVCLNIRSINAHFDELLLFLENNLYYNKIDIIVLTETWHDTISCPYKINGYNILFSNIKRNQNDGVIVFVKQHLSTDFYDFNYLENNIVKLSLIINNSPLIILCVYRSPSTDYTNFINS